MHTNTLFNQGFMGIISSSRINRPQRSLSSLSLGKHGQTQTTNIHKNTTEYLTLQYIPNKTRYTINTLKKIIG